MKVNVELDLTPEEFKELLLPSDKQTELTAAFTKAMMEATSKAAMEQFTPENMMKWFTPPTKGGGFGRTP